MMFFDVMFLNLLVLKGVLADAVYFLPAMYLFFVAATVLKKENSAAAGIISTIALALAVVLFTVVAPHQLRRDGSETARTVQLKHALAKSQKFVGYELFSVEGRTVHYTGYDGELRSVTLKSTPITKTVYVIEPETLAVRRSGKRIAGADLTRPTFVAYQIN